jgi:hypothetical protein
MASFLYNSARESFATGALTWDGSEIHCALVNATYGPTLQDVFLSDIPDGAIMADATLTALASDSGICSGQIPEFDAFISDTPCIAMVLYANSGDPSTSQLIYYSSDGVGFPFLPQGFNYAVGFDQTALGFFQV